MSLQLPAGVVFGEEYQKLVRNCKTGGFALPAVNVVGTDSINAVMEAAATNGSDVIIQLSNGGASFYAGKGVKNVMQLDDQEIDDLAEFLKWTSEMDTNNWPPNIEG